MVETKNYISDRDGSQLKINQERSGGAQGSYGLRRLIKSNLDEVIKTLNLSQALDYKNKVRRTMMNSPKP
jgi:hypothetical protein